MPARIVFSLILSALLLPPLLFIPSFPAFSDDEGGHISRTLFGPETFARANGTNFNRTFNVPATQGSFKLHVVNGDGAGHNKVTSATIKVNGTTVVRSSDLNQRVNHLDKTLNNLVNGSNSLNVQISSSSSPSSYLTVSITGTYHLDVRITDPPDGTQEQNDQVTVRGTYTSYTSNFTINVNGVTASASNGTFTAANVPLSGGSNTVAATIATVDGLSDTHTISLTLNRPPVADAGVDRNVTSGYAVVLDGRNSYDPEGVLISYLWSFASVPAGSASSLVNPSSVTPWFVPDRPGGYVVSLAVNDGVQDSLPDNVTVTAADNSPPTAIAGPDQSVATGSPVQLDGRGSFDPEGAPLLYSWSFRALPPGSAANLNADNSEMPTFAADLDGTYTVELTVSDGLSTGLPDNVNIVAAQPNAPPVAYAGMDLFAYRNTTVFLDGMQSYDPDNNALTYRWSVVSKPQGSTSELDNTSAARPSLRLDLEGDFVLRLVVNDGQVDSAPDTVVITSLNGQPVAEAGPDQDVTTGILAALDGSGSSDGNGDPLTFAWSIVSVPAGSAASLSDPSATRPTIVPDLAGQYVIRLVASDGWVTSVPDNVTLTAWPPVLSVPGLLGMTQAEAQSSIVSAGLAVGSVTTGYSDTVAPGRVTSQIPRYGSTATFHYPVDLVVSAGPIPLPPPPDPATVAPPVPKTVATTVAASTEFLYTGTDPIQRDVPPATIDVKRAAILRGIVKTRDGSALSGVAITILDHPEFGRTVTRDDGMFDMAVNGGGQLIVNYTKTGYMVAQRQVTVPWQDYAWLPDVVLAVYDNQVTGIDLALQVPMQVARGSVVTDADGTRQATLFFPQGIAAQMMLPDGSTRSISSFHVRATEYTVGSAGPAAMPAALPPASAYTYAVELSVDEAVAAGATEVTFDRPVYYYVENFVGIPVGTIVPSGYYDRGRGVWNAAPNGKVIKILGVSGGLADLDTDGNGAVDDTSTLAALNITDAERVQLAFFYPPGTVVWRIPITHFSSWDYNYPYSVPDGAKPPDGGEVVQSSSSDIIDSLKNIIPCWSIIECQGQTLGESIPVAGTPFSLNYRSTRVPGRRDAYTVDIPLSGPTIPPGLLRIDLQVYVAGKRFTQVFPAVPNQSTSFTWDGIDGYGRIYQGEQQITVRVGFSYPLFYSSPAEAFRSFSQFGGAAFEGSRGRTEVIVWQEWTGTVGSWDARAQGLGGWTLDVHHAYAPTVRKLALGNGTTRSAADSNQVIVSIPTPEGLNFPYGIAAAPDGSIYYVDTWNHQVHRVEPDGSGTRIAGTEVIPGGGTTAYNFGYNGDGIPAVDALLNFPTGVALDRDGNIYIADGNNHRIRRIAPNGIISTVAGTGEWGYNGDNIPATQAMLYVPVGVAIGPDGCLYIGDSANNRIRRVSLNGIITTVVGSDGLRGFNGDNILATQASLSEPRGIAFGPDGSLYIADVSNNRIRRVGSDGFITTVAGSGTWDISDDGIPAVLVGLRYPSDVAVAKDGSIYIAVPGNLSVRRVRPDGIITTIAGTGVSGFGGDGGPAASAMLANPAEIDIGPDGDLYVSNSTISGFGKIRKVTSAFPGLSINEIAISAENGREVYHFDGYGRHLRTVDSVTGATVYQFDYDLAGYLSRITDTDNNVTTVERDGSGIPTAIVAPGGQRTSLSLDDNEYLASIANPAGDNVHLTYRPDGNGLLEGLVDQRGYPHLFAYDFLGRLERDDDPAGGYKVLARMDDGAGKGYSVDVTTALGRVTNYSVVPLVAGGTDLVNTWPGGAQTTMRIGSDDVRTTWSPDNTVTEMVNGPDPRFGMQAPIPTRSTVWTPGGLVRTETMSRTASLADPNDLLSLLRQTDTQTVNGRTYTTLLINANLRYTTTTPAGRWAVSSIDNKGRLVSLQADNTYSPSVLPVTFSYDPKGRLYQTGQGGNLWTYLYDDRNRLVRKVDPMDNAIVYGYDDADRVTSVTLPSGRTYRFTYDTGGNRTQVVMPSLAVHGLGYTPVNLDNVYSPPESLPYLHGYSLDREWNRTTLPGGREITASYDPASGRPDSVAYPEGSLTYGYTDNTGRLFSLRRTGGDNTTQTISFGYDGFLATRLAFSGSATGEFLYAYDNNFWVTDVALDNAWNLLSRDNDGLLTGFGPFTFGRGGPAGAPDNVSDLETRTCTLDNAGLPTLCPPGSLDLQYGYDSFGRVNRRTQSVNGTQVYEVVLDRDPVGRITRKIETSGGATSTFEYRYDIDGQLIEVRRNGALSEQYGYDNNANRTSTLVSSAAYDDQDRLLQMGSVNYIFDADGYLTTRGSDTFTYSARGELLSTTAGGQTITYAYDGTGRRVAKTDNGGTTQYLYGNLSNPFQVTASRAPDNTLTVYYYDDFGVLYALERGGVRYYVGSDHLGTPKVITDNTGTIVRQVEYDSWGVKIGDTNPGFDLPIGFAGGIPDDATGLVRFGFRDYEPVTGRWAAKDPIFFYGGQANLFQYCGNDPVNFKDPSGRGWWSDKAWPAIKNWFWSVFGQSPGAPGGAATVTLRTAGPSSVGGVVAGTGAGLLDPELGPEAVKGGMTFRIGNQGRYDIVNGIDDMSDANPFDNVPRLRKTCP